MAKLDKHPADEVPNELYGFQLFSELLLPIGFSTNQH